VTWTAKRTHLLAAALCLAVGMAAAGSLVLWHDYPAHHFATVEDGVLYRSGQPNARGWEAMLKTYHLQTVVCLRGAQANEADDAPWLQQERDFCQRNGITLVMIPVGKTLSPAQAVERFLGLVRQKADQPVLVHCEFGSTRTGLAVAAYRIAVQRWSYEAAMAEARRYRYAPPGDQTYDRLLRSIAAGEEWAPNHAASGPTSQAAAN
jgi:tyrosine-protein phosphatase SIW14